MSCRRHQNTENLIVFINSILFKNISCSLQEWNISAHNKGHYDETAALSVVLSALWASGQVAYKGLRFYLTIALQKIVYINLITITGYC